MAFLGKTYYFLLFVLSTVPVYLFVSLFVRGIDGDNDGWQYALDFPRTYHPKQSRTSCVRRRVWSRYYRFDGYDRWIKVPGLTEDPVKHPFQDIAVGGTSIPGQESGCLAVWAVTFHGKVIYRSGVSEKCPEGDKWIEIPSPQVSITQLSVSPSGVVWGVTWEGVAVVRVGVSYYQPTGEEEICFTILIFLALCCHFKCGSGLNN